MAAPNRMNDLAERKRLLIAEAELHRSMIDLSRVEIAESVQRTREHVRTHRWWILGGAVLAGIVTMRGGGGLTRWIPLAATAWRIVQGLRAQGSPDPGGEPPAAPSAETA